MKMTVNECIKMVTSSKWVETRGEKNATRTSEFEKINYFTLDASWNTRLGIQSVCLAWKFREIAAILLLWE